MELTWARGYGGPGDERGAAIASDAAGDLDVTGAFEGTVDFRFIGPESATLADSGATVLAVAVDAADEILVGPDRSPTQVGSTPSWRRSTPGSADTAG
ncbi:hypothetical protein [Sorangium sp. So ce1153]|uniref:hypothetical protein n=1 Tax=Sorangium sp. So ce1153 TaxID=3133333 RepID=UPI003F5D6BE3